MGQIIKKGRGNIQVGRDLTIIEADRLSRDDGPNLINCPDCHSLVSARATPCPKCGLNVKLHFYIEHLKLYNKRLKQKNKRLCIAAATLMALGLILLYLSTHLPESLRISAVFAGVVLGLIGYACADAADRQRSPLAVSCMLLDEAFERLLKG